MSFWDYVLPWKAVPNMVRDVKEASDLDGKNKNKSIFGAIGKYADPGGALLGDRWMDFWHERVPERVNEYLQPVGAFHRKYLDPIAMALPEDHKAQKVADFGENKGGDALAAVLAMYFGGAALGGLSGFGGGGGAGGAGGGGGGFGGLNFGSMNWSDPNTYMQMAQLMPQQQQQAPPPPPPPQQSLLQRPPEAYQKPAGVGSLLRQARGFA